ncbi:MULTISPECIES: hypothetical protein [Sphingobacterium]|uniref:hypothetical protein n=1 Tax=Sphingobacterium TaxID=28453 RepID=UPI00257FE94F|nr:MULTISPECIES: hypothetical protein [Sphingobacterium]
MKNKLSLKAVFANLLLAMLIGTALSFAGFNAVASTAVVFGVGTGLQFVKPFGISGAFIGLQTEIWVPGIKENPVPDTSFVAASTDLSEFVENNKLHLAEAGVEPGVHEDYFEGNDDDLPFATIEDIPGEVVLKTYSTEQTRHRRLQEVELQYNRKESIINRHKISLGKNIGKRAAFAWSPTANNAFNKILKLGANDSVIDALIDIQLFYAQLDKTDGLNFCLDPIHMAKIRKENVKLYKEILAEKGQTPYGFKIYSYTQNPIYTDAGVKKPFGAVMDATDKRASFAWCTDEVFRCFGDTEMYATLGASGSQADTISFAQRALVGNIRASAPKYLAAIY